MKVTASLELLLPMIGIEVVVIEIHVEIKRRQSMKQVEETTQIQRQPG